MTHARCRSQGEGSSWLPGGRQVRRSNQRKTRPDYRFVRSRVGSRMLPLARVDESIRSLPSLSKRAKPASPSAKVMALIRSFPSLSAESAARRPAIPTEPHPRRPRSLSLLHGRTAPPTAATGQASQAHSVMPRSCDKPTDSPRYSPSSTPGQGAPRSSERPTTETSSASASVIPAGRPANRLRESSTNGESRR